MEFKHQSNRLYAENEDLLLAEVTFPNIDEMTVKIDRVFVDPSLRGQGVAAEIMAATYQYIKSRGLKAIAKCPYAIAWFKRNPDKQDILAETL